MNDRCPLFPISTFSLNSGRNSATSKCLNHFLHQGTLKGKRSAFVLPSQKVMSLFAFNNRGEARQWADYETWNLSYPRITTEQLWIKVDGHNNA